MNKRLKAFALAVLALCMVSPPLLATENEGALWLIGSVRGTIDQSREDPRWQYRFQGQARGFDALAGTRQWVIQASATYKIGNGFSLSGGYRFFKTNSKAAGQFHEQRTWQSLNWASSNLSFGTLKSRTMLEQRFVDERSGTAVRLRQQIRLDAPMNSRPGWYWIVGIEPLYDLRNTTWVETGLNQNRTFLGLGLPLTSRTKMEIGYMHQWIDGLTRETLVNHTLVAHFTFRRP